MKARLFARASFLLRENPFVKGGDLKFETVKIYLKGGCHHGQWNSEVVQ